MTCTKARYRSRAYARKALQQLRGSGLRCDGLRPYKCEACAGTWHLGHLPRAVIAGKITRGEAYGASK